MKPQMMRVISSPSSSTTGVFTWIFAILSSRSGRGAGTGYRRGPYGAGCRIAPKTGQADGGTATVAAGGPLGAGSRHVDASLSRRAGRVPLRGTRARRPHEGGLLGARPGRRLSSRPDRRTGWPADVGMAAHRAGQRGAYPQLRHADRQPEALRGASADPGTVYELGFMR